MNFRQRGMFTSCVLLLFISGGARAMSPEDLRDYTLDAPPEKGGSFDTHQAAALTEHWDKHGVVRIAVISDHNQGYELWSGVELIEVETKKLYNVSAVRCFVSFCVYVGKVPPGKYFINRLYADSFEARSSAPIRQVSAPIRNQLGSFDVRVHALTDLGMVGVFRGVEHSRDRSFETAFLGYSEDLGLIFGETYRGFDKKYFGITGPELHWDAGEWQQDALGQSLARRRFFADFSRTLVTANVLYFPTVMGAIYSLDGDHELVRGDVGTLFMLTAVSMSGDRWVAGTEAGRLYVSENRGASWKSIEAFPRDEVVAHLFERGGVRYALTVSQKQSAAKLYRATGDRFEEISSTRFALEGKVMVPRLLVALAGGKRSLTKLYLNRIDLKKVRVLESSDLLTVQLNSRRFASFDFAIGGWLTYDAAQPVHWASADRAGVWLMSEKPGPITTIVQLGPDLSGQRSYREIKAAPRGGFHVREDGSKMAVLGLVDEPPNSGKPAEAGIYALLGDASPAQLRSLGDLGFYYDSELRMVGEALVLIDRVAPRVYRFTEGRAITYSLYSP